MNTPSHAGCHLSRATKQQAAVLVVLFHPRIADQTTGTSVIALVLVDNRLYIIEKVENLTSTSFSSRAGYCLEMFDTSADSSLLILVPKFSVLSKHKKPYKIFCLNLV